ncbi:hypothetical protein Aperf_G00000023124 [Anoplocephala perfoliata]
MGSTWKETPVLAEAAEYLAQLSSTHFWNFIDTLESLSVINASSGIFSPDEKISFDAMQALENIVLDVQGVPTDRAGNYNLKRCLFRLTLSSRALSPAVQTANQMASVAHFQWESGRQNICQDRTTWGRIGSMFICDLDQLEISVRKALLDCSFGCPEHLVDSVLLSDKVYPTKNESHSIPHLIIHGDLRCKEFYQWHRIAKSLAVDDEVIYIFRHFLKTPAPSKTWLNGYGIALDLKSTEYKAMDDKSSDERSILLNSSHSSDSLDLNELESVVQGFNFTQLRANYPELKSELNAFQHHLVTGTTELKPLKAWQMRDLALQAAQTVMEVATENDTDISGLLMLRDLSQNFPSRLSQRKVSDKLKNEVKFNQNILEQLYGIGPGSNVLLLNGLALSPDIDIYALLDLLRSESHLLNQLHGLELSTEQAAQLLQASPRGDDVYRLSTFMDSYKYTVTGEYLLDIRAAPILFLNDIERNPAYSSWLPNLHALFMMGSPGSLRQIRKNLFTVVFIVDPTEPVSMEMFKLAEIIIMKKVPLRVGILWSVNPEVDSVGRSLARVFTYLAANAKTYPDRRGTVSGLGNPGAMTALNFLTDLYAAFDETVLTTEIVESAFKKAFPDAYSEDIFVEPGFECSLDIDIKSHFDFLEVSGIRQSAGSPSLISNGMVFSLEGINKMGGLQETIMTTAMEQTTYFQQATFEGRFYDGLSAPELFAADGLFVSRVNHRLLPVLPPLVNKFALNDGSDGTSVTPFLQFGQMDASSGDPNASAQSAGEITNFLADEMRYLQKGDLESETRANTLWVVLGDIEPSITSSNHSLKLLAQAARFMRRHATMDTRLGFVLNPFNNIPTSEKGIWGDPGWLTRALLLIGHPAERMLSSSANESSTSEKYMSIMAAKNFVLKVTEEALKVVRGEAKEISPLSEMAVSGLEVDKFQRAFADLDLAAKLALHTSFCQKTLHMHPGDSAVIINGRVYGPFLENETFASEDFRLAEQLSIKSAGMEAMAKQLAKMLPDRKPNFISELVWRAASVLESAKWRLSSFAKSLSSEGIFASGGSSRIALNDIKSAHSVFTLPAKTGSLSYNLVAVIDPVSRDAQRLSQILLVLRKSLPCSITVILNPITGLSDLPLKNYYRFVWQPSFYAPEGESLADVPSAFFDHLPGNSLLTLGVDAPHNWIVAPIRAEEDLDNLRLAEITSRTGNHLVEAEFELEYLLLEGHCLDESTRQPPRGLQFTLGTAEKLDRYDTIVMANLGYFQLKANPGAWHLNLRKGPSREIYNIIGHEYADSPPGAPYLIAVIDSFRPKIIRVDVQKKPDRLMDSVLDANEEEETGTISGGSGDSTKPLDKFWSVVDSTLKFIKKTSYTPRDLARNPSNETINIFSLASGHLYERFLRIMMLTVIRNTKSPVKFWFLKNYLSPSFKEFIPYMAEEYGFEYELVQYQWPRWLHAQTEKQRIIWGYKILFLDVLFPLSVKKIIFVDADQIVRADLQELVNLDLEGAPYGYTPFCDSRKEMEGFRFWKTGYWQSHLGNRPYHISALYVVDLVRFRKLAAGDRLRGQYHALSKDPSSLANLDQDLPNNMIHQVAIKSLPQEWLWCETWCSDSEKAAAKTIDLCNNPLTKEPKLSAAMRIIPDWTSFDNEIKKLQKRFAKSRGKIVIEESTTSTPQPVRKQDKSAEREEL